MKKYLLIIAAVALAFTACKQGPKPAKEVTFEITASDITEQTALIKVVPSDAKAYYYFDIVDAAYMEEFESDSAMVQDFIDYYVEMLEEYNEYYGTDYSFFEEFISQGEDELEYEGLNASTQYYAFAAVVDSASNKVKGKVFKVPFSTKEVTNVNLMFESALSDTAIWFLPNKDDIEYLPFYIDADSLNGYSISEYYEAYWEYMESVYAMYGYTLSDVAMAGPVYIPFTELEVGHSYIFAAKAYTAGVWNSQLFQTQFSYTAPNDAPAVKKGDINKAMRLKKAKKVSPMKGEFKAGKLAK